MKKEAFQRGFIYSVSRAKAKGELPLGNVGQVEVHDLEEDLIQLQKHLTQLRVSTSEIFCLEFSGDAKTVEKREGKLILPPLVIEVDKLKEVSLVGSFDLVSPRGFLWLGRTAKAQRIELFPSLLILSCLSKTLGIEAKGLLLKTGKTISVPLKDPFKQLSIYVQLYMRAVVKTQEEIEKKRLSSAHFKGFVDPYEEWMLKRDIFPEIEVVYEKWKREWEEVFSPLLSATVE